MLRLLFSLLTIILTGPALAQGQFDGTWSFVVTGQDDPLMIIELEETGGAIVGAGVIPDEQGDLQAGTVAVSAGAVLDTAMQVELTLDPQGGTAILTVIDGQGATLAVAGSSISGEFIHFGSRTTAAAAPIESETTPGDACTSMMEVQQEVILNADPTQRLLIQRVYDEADARFGQEQTAARCGHLLDELARLRDTNTVSAGPVMAPQTSFGTACDDVEPQVQAIFVDLEALGQSDNGRVQQLLDEAGLGVDGIWSTGACEYGIANLRDYQVTLGSGVVAETQGQVVPIKDPTLPVPQVQSNGLRDVLFQVRDVSDHLNLRAGPGTGYGVVYQLPYFARDLRIIGQGCSPAMMEAGFAELPVAAQIAELSSRWCEVDWNGTQGWVAARYLHPM